MSEMTSRERVLTALRHEETDRVPFSLGFGVNEPVRLDLMKYLGISSMKEMDEFLLNYSDVRRVRPEFCGPTDKNNVEADGTRTDFWGVVTKQVSYGRGYYDEIYINPLKNITDASELEKYQWPSVDWFDFDSLKSTVKMVNGKNEYAIITGIANIFETSWYMRGFEQMLIDIMIDKEIAWNIMTKVTDFFIAYYERLLQSAEGMIDIVFTADDIGQQEGLLVSLDLFEEMIKPHHVRLNKVLHEYGVKVMYHTDGAVMQAMPGLIDMGIDILEAIQFDAKDMDPLALKTLYGDKICFHGGISVQKTLPFGSVEDVKNEVRERIKVLGKNSGYILAPSHAIQDGTPPENVMALLSAPRL